MIWIIVFIIGLFQVVFSSAFDCTRPPIMTNIKQCCQFPELLKSQIADQCASTQTQAEGREQGPPDSCFVGCVFNSVGILNNGQFDKDKLKKTLSDLKVDSDMAGVMEKSFMECSDRARIIMAHMPLRGVAKCDLYPAVLLGCAVRETFVNCPAGKWQSTSQCSNIKEFFINCPSKGAKA